ncbi:MAG: winged helix-turn-helix domain-containing protein, partial [Candidatus Wallbacteria bacterium]|nr:winged helix-turn-helix domain-containing protein [Candidatus Wallbacteria bacterium]
MAKLKSVEDNIKNLGWHDAIIEVLAKSKEPMHYTDISDAIIAQKLKKRYGATPAATVNACITQSLNQDGSCSPFIRHRRGYFWLRDKTLLALQSGNTIESSQASQEQEEDETGLINAFGMLWSRSKVDWISGSKPKIQGQQQNADQTVDFCDQRGVYLLHNGHAIVFVGRTTDQPLGVRLKQHTM